MGFNVGMSRNKQKYPKKTNNVLFIVRERNDLGMMMMMMKRNCAKAGSLATYTRSDLPSFLLFLGQSHIPELIWLRAKVSFRFPSSLLPLILNFIFISHSFHPSFPLFIPFTFSSARLHLILIYSP